MNLFHKQTNRSKFSRPGTSWRHLCSMQQRYWLPNRPNLREKCLWKTRFCINWYYKRYTKFHKNVSYFWHISLIIYILFSIWLTLAFKWVVKKSLNLSLNLTFKSQFQSLNSSKSFWFFYYQKVIGYSNVFSLWLLFDNSHLTLVLKTPQVLLSCISGYENSNQKVECKDKHPTKKCKKLKKKGKCKVEKISKKCELTCKKCTPGTLT